MRTTILAGVMVMVSADVALAQSWRPPSEAERCPSKWGAQDQRGSANLMKPETVLRAARLIHTGEISSPVHQIMLAVNGIHLLESLKLDELVAKRVYEFALVLEPLKLKGATGSTVAPMAIH